jgi:DNA-directed RNA polymerase subunit RPC12/RpoP
MSVQQGKPSESPEASGKMDPYDSSQRPEIDVRQESVKCPSCGYSFITKVNGKCKLRTRVLIFVENGNTMGICPKCKTNLKVPVTLMSRLGLSHACHEKEGRT